MNENKKEMSLKMEKKLRELEFSYSILFAPGEVGQYLLGKIDMLRELLGKKRVGRK